MKKNILLMYAIALFQGMVFYGPIATLYRQTQGLSVFQITIIESISLGLGLLLELPWGIVADKIGYRKTVLICCLLYFLSKIIFWQATGFGGFLAERILLSVVLSGLSGVDTSILYLSCQGKDSQKIFGLYNSMSMAGLLFAAAVFSLAVGEHYRLAGLLTVVSYAIAALLACFLTEVKQKPANEVPSEPFRVTLQATLRNRTFLLFLLAVALVTETHQTVTVFLSQLQYARCGLDSPTMGFLYIFVTVLGLLGVCSAAVTRRINTLPSLVLFCGLAALSCGVLSVAEFALPSVLGIFTLRTANTLFQPLQWKIQNQEIRTENRATALSIHAMLLDCAAIGTNLIFGALSDWNLSAAFLFGCCSCALSLFFILLWHKRTGTQQE